MSDLAGDDKYIFTGLWNPAKINCNDTACNNLMAFANGDAFADTSIFPSFRAKERCLVS